MKLKLLYLNNFLSWKDIELNFESGEEIIEEKMLKEEVIIENIFKILELLKKNNVDLKCPEEEFFQLLNPENYKEKILDFIIENSNINKFLKDFLEKFKKEINNKEISETENKKEIKIENITEEIKLENKTEENKIENEKNTLKIDLTKNDYQINLLSDCLKNLYKKAIKDLEDKLEKQKKNNNNNYIHLITGPNKSGKSNIFKSIIFLRNCFKLIEDREKYQKFIQDYYKRNKLQKDTLIILKFELNYDEIKLFKKFDGYNDKKVYFVFSEIPFFIYNNNIIMKNINNMNLFTFRYHSTINIQIIKKINIFDLYLEFNEGITPNQNLNLTSNDLKKSITEDFNKNFKSQNIKQCIYNEKVKQDIWNEMTKFFIVSIGIVIQNRQNINNNEDDNEYTLSNTIKKLIKVNNNIEYQNFFKKFNELFHKLDQHKIIVCDNEIFFENNNKYYDINDVAGSTLEIMIILCALIINKPETILLDEPAYNIQTSKQKFFFEKLAEYSKNCTVIVVTHSINFINEKSIENLYHVQKLNEFSECKKLNSFWMNFKKDEKDETQANLLKKELLYSFPEVFFANIVLFVEGVNDKFYFNNVKHFITKNQSKNDIFYDIQVIDMGGKYKFKRIFKFMEYFNIKYFVQFDYDVFYQNKSEKTKIENENGYLNNIIGKYQFLSENKLDMKSFNKLLKELKIICINDENLKELSDKYSIIIDKEFIEKFKFYKEYFPIDTKKEIELIEKKFKGDKNINKLNKIKKKKHISEITKDDINFIKSLNKKEYDFNKILNFIHDFENLEIENLENYQKDKNYNNDYYYELLIEKVLKNEEKKNVILLYKYLYEKINGKLDNKNYKLLEEKYNYYKDEFYVNLEYTNENYLIYQKEKQEIDIYLNKRISDFRIEDIKKFEKYIDNQKKLKIFLNENEKFLKTENKEMKKDTENEKFLKTENKEMKKDTENKKNIIQLEDTKDKYQINILKEDNLKGSIAYIYFDFLEKNTKNINNITKNFTVEKVKNQKLFSNEVYNLSNKRFFTWNNDLEDILIKFKENYINEDPDLKIKFNSEEKIKDLWRILSWDDLIKMNSIFDKKKDELFLKYKEFIINILKDSIFLEKLNETIELNQIEEILHIDRKNEDSTPKIEKKNDITKKQKNLNTLGINSIYEELVILSLYHFFDFDISENNDLKELNNIFNILHKNEKNYSKETVLDNFKTSIQHNNPTELIKNIFDKLNDSNYKIIDIKKNNEIYRDLKEISIVTENNETPKNIILNFNEIKFENTNNKILINNKNYEIGVKLITIDYNNKTIYKGLIKTNEGWKSFEKNFRNPQNVNNYKNPFMIFAKLNQ